MNNAEDWSKTDNVERALIVLASFDVWTLKEAAYLYAGLLPPEYKCKDQSNMIVELLFAEKTLRALESATKEVEGRLSLMFSGTGGLNIEIKAVDDKGRFKAAELLEFMCHMFSERSMKTLVGYRKRGLEANALESLREFEFSQRPRAAPEEIKPGLLLRSGEVWESEELGVLAEAVQKFWIPWRDGDTEKIPSNAVVEQFLESGGKKGSKMAESNAKVLARVARPKNLARRQPKARLITG